MLKRHRFLEIIPYGRHGAVITIQLHLDMVNIGIRCGKALQHWKQVLDIMLEKKHGDSHIHRLRIIQLFEADYKFILALIFGHRLAQFTDKHCSMNDAQYGSTSGQ